MLKPSYRQHPRRHPPQPPSGGCVLKQIRAVAMYPIETQPPSGGCVLKLLLLPNSKQIDQPAAFRRLCVETLTVLTNCHLLQSQPPSGGCVLKHFLQKLYFLAVHPAAFRRLCVETRLSRMTCSGFCQPPSGGCVLKLRGRSPRGRRAASRLQAAVC